MRPLAGRSARSGSLPRSLDPPSDHRPRGPPVSMTTPQGGNSNESGVIRITRKAVAGAGKPPMNGTPEDETGDVDASAADEIDTDAVDEDVADSRAKRAGGSGTSKATASTRGSGRSGSAGGRSGSATSGGRTPAQKKAVPGKSGARKGGSQGQRRPGSAPVKGGSRRPPQVVVAKTRNWTTIALVSAAIVAFGAIVGYGVYALQQKNKTFQQKADGISGIVDYRKKDPKMLTRNHVTTVVNYPLSPPVGGNHNPNYQRCAADVYSAPIANENAVHSLEHGAVWITYRPDLPVILDEPVTAEVKKYSDFILMSPYPNLSSPISLQAWGFQLKVNNASDPRIDQFVQDLRVNASMEPGIDCTSGNYVTA